MPKIGKVFYGDAAQKEVEKGRRIAVRRRRIFNIGTGLSEEEAKAWHGLSQAGNEREKGRKGPLVLSSERGDEISER
jgi:hypothetical protein